MLARPGQRRQFAMNGVIGSRLERLVHGVERQRWRSAERGAHQDDRSKHVRPDQRAPGGNGRAEIMPDHGVDRAVAERRHQPERVAHQIGEPERAETAFVTRIPPGGAAIAALVRRDHVIAGLRQDRHHLAPGEGEFGKAVQQQHARPAARFEAGFEHVHAQAVDIFHVARADGGGERDVGKGGHCLRLSSPLPLWERDERKLALGVDRMSASSFETGEGLLPRRHTPHPPSRSAKAPSPTRGEGREVLRALV